MFLTLVRILSILLLFFFKTLHSNEPYIFQRFSFSELLSIEMTFVYLEYSLNAYLFRVNNYI